MARGLLDLWNNWSIQILVLLSLALQVILFLFAGIRRYESSVMPKLCIWLAYLLADSTAIYAVGLLSISSAVREHPLVAFWSPFLMLHLGGPDNITAYSLEDNQLWHRHLQTFVVQVLGTAYVLYKNIMTRSGKLLVLAAALMFSVGGVKYLERTWALKCSNLDSMRSSVKKEQRTTHNHDHRQDKAQEEDEDEFLVRRAHSLFHICKRGMVDSSVDKSRDIHDTTKMGLSGLWDDRRQLWTLMEMELSLMYDILYTKAAVIHTWFGYLVRVISPLAIVASLLLFQLSGKDGYNRVDVTITYVLLAGALSMETASLLNALGSSWTYAFLCTTKWGWLRYEALCSERWDQLRRAAVSLQRRVKKITGGGSSYRSRWWSDTMGQYNMLHFCTRRDTPTSPLLGRLAKMVGLQERWDRKHYSGSIDISDTVKENIMDHMMRLKRDINLLGVLRKKWGQKVLELDHNKAYLELKDHHLLGVEFQEGIIIWHIATDVFLAVTDRAKVEDASARVEAIKAMSNYMMFLLVERPYMLAGLSQNRLYEQTCENLVEMVSTPSHRKKGGLHASLESLFRVRDHPGSNSRAAERKELAKTLYDQNPTEAKLNADTPRVHYVVKLAKKLVEKEAGGEDSLKLVFDVWTDFLIYAGNKCSRESHAKKLNSGGDLITILWLMAEHRFQASIEDA